VSLVPESIWITWEYQVRNRSLSNVLGVPLKEIVVEGRWPLTRYYVSAVETFRIIKSQRPKTVFHQSPSIFLGLLLILLRKFYGYRLITDTHNAGILPAEGKYGLLNAIGKFVTKRTNVAIVHNELVAADVKLWGVEPFVLPDPLPDMSIDGESPEEYAGVSKNEVVFICRWSPDEPFEEVIQAAQILLDQGSDVTITITGKPPSMIAGRSLPSNVALSGYLSDEDYKALLGRAAALLVLTNRVNSLNCGAYEALALAKPCVLFNSSLLRKFFGDGFVYTSLDASAISRALNDVTEELPSYRDALVLRRRQYVTQFDGYVRKLVKRCFLQ